MDFEKTTKNIADGLMVMEKNGKIQMMNANFKRYIGLDKDLPVETFSDFLRRTIEEGKNDKFCDFINEAVMGKCAVKSKIVEFAMDGQTKYYRVHASYDEVDDYYSFTIGDITNEIVYQKKCKDATLVTTLMIVFLSLCNFMYVIWEMTDRPITSSDLTLLIMLLGGIGVVISLKTTNLKLKDMGFEFKGKGKAILTDALFTAGLMVVLILIKLVLVFTGTMETEKPFFDFSVYLLRENMYYPVTVFFQETLSRGFLHNTINGVFVGKHKNFVAILVSSALFSAVHIHKGLAFMIAAALLLSIFGVIYNKQKSIWGLCIPHYFLSMTCTVLGLF